MAAEDNSPEAVHINEVKRLDPSLTLKRNRSQLEAVLVQLQGVVRKEELQTGLVVRVPLRNRGLQELTVSHYTRDGVPQNEQDGTLYWSDYAALLLDLAAKFKKTSLKDEFAQYAPTETQLEEWSHAPNTETTVVDELTTWEHRYDIAELAAKLAGAFMTGIEEVTEEEVTDEPEKPADKNSVTEDDKAKLPQTTLAARQQNRENATAVVPKAAGADDVSQSQLDPTQLPTNLPPEQVEKLSAEGLSVQELQQRYSDRLQLLIQFSIGQAARDRDIPISQLEPELISQITALAQEYLQNGDDFSFLFKRRTNREEALLKFQLHLKRFGVDIGTFYTPLQALEQDIHDITNDSNPLVNKNIETFVDAIVISHGERAAEIIDSFNKQKVEIIFGLEAYNLSDTQVTELKTVLKNYAEYRLIELAVYTESEDTKKGLVGKGDLNPEDSLALINVVRDTIVAHSDEGNQRGEIVADGLATTSGKTRKKIKFALEQNSKIFGAYWNSLTPEEQAIALTALGTGHLVQKKHPVEGYELPINIAELNPAIFKKYKLEIQRREQLATESIAELAYAEEVNSYVNAALRAESLSLQMRNEYVLETAATIRVAMHDQQALDQMNYYEMIAAEEEVIDTVPGTSPIRSRLGGYVNSRFDPKKKIVDGLGKVAKNKAASMAKSEVAEKIAAKLAGGSGVLTAAYVGYKVLEKVIGKENTKKLLVALGGIAAGTIGAIIYKTIQMMQTVGGAIGGTVGGTLGLIYGGPFGGLFGALGGATAGSNFQNWLTGLFGKGTSSTAATSTSFSVPSFAGSAPNVATVTAPAAPTFVRPLPKTPLPSTGQAANAITRFTQTVTSAPSTAAASATATLQTATVAATNIFTSLPAIVVGGSTLVPGLATIIVFLVIMGAFLVPMPFTISKQERTVSRYAIVNKTATPDEIENNTEEDITYEIEIAARTGYSLELKRISDEFTVLGGEATISGESPVSVASFESTRITTPQSVTYTIPISGEDALVINTVTFVVDVYDSSGKIVLQGESVTTLGLLIIGDPPIGCFEFAPGGIPSEPYSENGQQRQNISKNWEKSDIIKFLQAFIRRVGTNESYLELLCTEGDIIVYKWDPHPNRNYFAWVIDKNTIGFYQGFFNSPVEWMEYTLVHESGHIIDGRNPGLKNGYLQIATSCLTYPFPEECSSRPSEYFAEGLVDYVVYQTLFFNFDSWTGMFPFKTNYPAEYNWMRDNIFGGIEY